MILGVLQLVVGVPLVCSGLLVVAGILASWRRESHLWVEDVVVLLVGLLAVSGGLWLLLAARPRL